jgi:hypothetical protein
VKGLVAFVVALVAVLLAATWSGGSSTACPAVAWGSSLRIELADGWPAADAVRVECPSRCGLASQPVDGGPDAATVPLTGTTASVSFLMGAPTSVTASVLGPDGAVLAEADLDLDWVRVGGTAECGGPHEATATVPAA